MPFVVPTLQDINDRVKSDIQSRLGVQPLLPNSVLSILAASYAAAVHLLYGFLAWIFEQVFADTAELEQLERWGSLVGILRTEATFSEGLVTFTGVNGSVIPIGTIVQRSDSAQFITQAEGTISSGTVDILVEALEAGADGNTEAGIILTLLNPITGVQSSQIVEASGIAAGADQESDDNLRVRVLDRFRNPPQGGSESDYEAWALSIAGVTNGWVFPQNQGEGTVGVAIAAYEDITGPIPSSQLVSDTQDYVDTVRPVTANVTVFAPTELLVPFTIQLSPNTSEVQANVTAELEDLFRRTAEPGGTILISKIREAVSIAAGEGDNVVVSPAANVVAATGELPVVGAFTFSVIP